MIGVYSCLGAQQPLWDVRFWTRLFVWLIPRSLSEKFLRGFAGLLSFAAVQIVEEEGKVVNGEHVVSNCQIARLPNLNFIDREVVP